MGNYSSSCSASSILGPLFLLIYINDLIGNLNSNVKLFADGTSLFSEICDPLETVNVLNNDFKKFAIDPNN